MIRRSMMPMLGQAQTPEQEAQQMNILRLMQSATNQQARSQGAFDMMRRGNNGAGGYLGALAMGIGGYLNRKKQEKAEAQQLEALKEIGLLKQSQSEWAQQQAIAQAQQEEAAYKRKKADELEKWQREQDGKKDFAKYNASLKSPEKMSVSEQQWAMLTPEQKQQAAMVHAGLSSKQEAKSDEIQQGVESGLITPEEAETRKREKLLGITSGDRKAESARVRTVESLKRLRDSISEHGTECGGKKAARMEAQFRDAQLNMKDAYNLGVLSGQDEVILTDLVDNPTSFWSQFNPMKGGNTVAKLDEVIKSFESSGSQSQPPQPSASGENTLLKYTR